MKLKNKSFVIYATNKCPFCIKVKEHLKAKDISFDAISFDKRPTALKEIKEIYDWKTVPMVFERLDKNTYRLIILTS